MRPIDKGTTPLDASGAPKSVGAYGQWRSDLIDRLGFYCVYCDMPLSHSLQVEHAVPKVPVAGATAGSLLDWDNMVLACGPCNNHKGNQPSSPNLHYLPESHNTLLAYQDKPHPTEKDAWIVGAKAELNSVQQKKAEDTIEMLKLTQIDRRRQVVDIRWKRRKTAAVSALAARHNFDMAIASPTYNAPIFAENIALIALSTGFYAIWADVFADQPLILNELIKAFPGTATKCFDTKGVPIPRNPAHATDPI